MLATTKQARKIARSVCAVDGRSYTDVSACKRKTGTNLRNVTFFIRYNTAEAQAQQLREAMFLCGFTNKVKITLGATCYLRINNCILEV
jgi:hypothetical protein